MTFFSPHRLMGLCALALVACGGSTERTSSEASSEAPPETFPDPAPPDPPKKRGSITMWSVDGAFLASASFGKTEQTARPQGCMLHAPVAGTEGADSSSVSAGLISIEVPTRDGTHPLRLEFDKKDKRYRVVHFEGLGKRPDLPAELIRIEARGAELPAFKTAIESAHDVEFTAPPKDLEIHAATGDIPVRWDSTFLNDEVFVSLDLLSASVSCVWPVSQGGGMIPGDLVKELYDLYQKEKKTAEPCQNPLLCTRIFIASTRRHETGIDDRELVVSHGIASMNAVRVTP